MIRYARFSAPEFVADAYFLRSHLAPDAESRAFWQTFLAEYPARRAAYDEARALLSQLSTEQTAYAQTQLPADQRQALWQRIEQSVQPTETTRSGRVVALPSTRRWSMRAAAVAGLVLLSLAGWWWTQRTAVPTQYQTAYGETRRVQLPDGSAVTLNANSTLQLVGDWQAGQDRRVTLTGEAFFEVTHQPGHERFLVTGGGVVVEVLGTKFNVNTRRERTRVALQEGRVKLAAEGTSLVMKPGETVEWSPKRPTLEKTDVPVAQTAAWTSQRLVFDQTPLSDVAQTIEDHFGTRVEIRNPALRDKRLTGEISLANEALLLEALETIYGIRARRDSATLVLE
jgi:ferric-dicitrate binding protein FerR (iron transport regulator)